jgi:uncharacterized protein YoxC
MGIILEVKALVTIDKLNDVLDDIKEKLNSINPLFNIIDNTSLTIKSITKKISKLKNHLLKKERDD